MVFAFAGDSTITSGFGTAAPCLAEDTACVLLGTRVADRSPSPFRTGPSRCRRPLVVAFRLPYAYRLTCAAVMIAVMTAVNWLSAKDLIETFGTIGLILIVFVESGLL